MVLTSYERDADKNKEAVGNLPLFFLNVVPIRFCPCMETHVLHCATYVFFLVFPSIIKRESFIERIMTKSQQLTSEIEGKQEVKKQI